MVPASHPRSAETSLTRNGAGVDWEGAAVLPGKAPAPHRPAVPASPTVPQKAKDTGPFALLACTVSHDPAGPSLRSTTVSRCTSTRPVAGRPSGVCATAAANRERMTHVIVR